MKGWIRWKGLIAFAVVVIGIVLVWFLVVDAVVRRTIESLATRAVGARVDLAKADLSLFPTGLALSGLAVTNPDSPMTNAIEIGQMKMDLDPGYLIRRKVIINTMQVEGVRFNTPRQTSGEMPELAAKRAARKAATMADVSNAAVEKVCGRFTMPSLTKPDVKAILAQESLESLALANSLDETLKAERVRWEKELERLADKKTLEAYRQRIDKITGSRSLGALVGAAGDIQQLQADIQKDLNLLKQAQRTFTSDFKTYQQQVRDLASAPRQDIDRLMNKYSLSPTGLANMSQLIFGEQLCGWVQNLAVWYGKIEPYIGQVPGRADNAPQEQTPLRGEGKNILFPETPPMPDFLIRNLKVNAAVTAGNLTGKAENLTLDQHILGRPATFAFLGREMERIDALDLIGTADFIVPDNPKNNARLNIQGLGLNNLPLVREGSLPLTLKQATGDLRLNLETVGRVLDAGLKADFGAVEFLSDTGGGQTAIAEAIQSAMAGVDRFNLSADIAGTLDAYTVTIRSDLDKLLKSAVGSLVKKEADRFQAALNQQITQRLEGPLTQVKDSMAGLGGIESELAERLNLGDDLLKDLKLPF